MVELTVDGPPGGYFIVEVCEALGAWIPIGHSTMLEDGAATLIDVTADTSSIRFYRLMQP